MHENNDLLQKSSHRLSSTPIRTHPHKMQMKIYDICFLLTAQKPQTTVNKPVLLPCPVCCSSELLFPRTCAKVPQTLIVYGCA